MLIGGLILSGASGRTFHKGKEPAPERSCIRLNGADGSPVKSGNLASQGNQALWPIGSFLTWTKMML